MVETRAEERNRPGEPFLYRAGRRRVKWAVKDSLSTTADPETWLSSTVFIGASNLGESAVEVMAKVGQADQGAKIRGGISRHDPLKNLAEPRLELGELE